MLSGSPRKTIREFVNRVVQVFGCEAAAFYYRPADEIARSGPDSQVVSEHDLLAAAEIEDLSIDAERGILMAPVRLGGRPLGSLALVGPPPSEETARAIVNLAALTIEKARALEDASHAEAARQSEVLKSALLDSLAHDIKTPLTSIKAAVTSLLEQASGADRELLTIINEEADRLNQLAAEVIEMARIEAGKLHLEKRAVAVSEMIEAALADLGGALKRRQLSLNIPPDLPPADADPEFAGQVVKQLVENALKYTPEGSPISVSAELKGGKIVIGVADRGPGIEENERAADFREVLPRAAAPLRYRRHRHGTGDRQRHRGSARRKNLGGERARGRARSSTSRCRRMEEPDERGKILVVDDDPQIRRVMKATLVGHNYEVIEARTGEEALETLPREMPNLVLLDMNMPGMGGLETCRAIRDGSEIPVMILSVRNTEKDKVAALDAGADDYVTKPFSIEELLARIRAALRRWPGSSEGGPRGFTADDLEIDFETRRVRAHGKQVRLTPKEFELLRYLVAHAGKPVTHRELLQAVWGPDYGDEPEYLRVFINQVRKKIEANPARPKYILTEPWVGYRFAGAPAGA